MLQYIAHTSHTLSHTNTHTQTHLISSNLKSLIIFYMTYVLSSFRIILPLAERIFSFLSDIFAPPIDSTLRFNLQEARRNSPHRLRHTSLQDTPLWTHIFHMDIFFTCVSPSLNTESFESRVPSPVCIFNKFFSDHRNWKINEQICSTTSFRGAVYKLCQTLEFTGHLV